MKKLFSLILVLGLLLSGNANTEILPNSTPENKYRKENIRESKGSYCHNNKTKEVAFWYSYFTCPKGYTKVSGADSQPVDPNDKKVVPASQGNNTLNRSFTCSFGYDLSEKSKIEIRGNTATEITAVGISINYSIVNLSNKGAFTLEGSSKDGRVWFIGAKSFLILDVKLLPYDCK